MLKKMILTALVGSSAFAAHQIEANVNDKDLEAQIRIDIDRQDSTYLGARFLSGDWENSDWTVDPDPLLEVSFMVQRPVRGVPGLKLGLGIKGEVTEFDGHRFAAVPLGVEGELRLPLNTPFPFYGGAVLYYAPSALCFEEGKEYMESRINLSFEPIDNGRFIVGYRKIDTDLEHRNVTYNDSWYFGMRLDF